MVNNTLLNALGGTNLEDRGDKTHISEDESETWQAMLDATGGLMAENAYRILAATSTYDNIDNIGAEDYTSSVGENNTVNSGQTTAIFLDNYYTLNPTFNVENANVDGIFLNISQNSTEPYGLNFSSDGTKLYILDKNSKIYQYALSTAYEIPTATYENIEYTITEDTDTSEVRFNLSGTKMYVLGRLNVTIFQYTLSTAWDVSTATYDSKSKNVSSEDNNSQSIYFKSDGTKMYVLGRQSGSSVYQYTLSTAWDVSTATYDSKSKDVYSQDFGMSSIYFKSDGTKMYALGFTNDNIYEYDISVAWDVSTATYNSNKINVHAQDNEGVSIFFKPDGLNVYMLGRLNKNVFSYSLSTAWDISTTIYTIKKLDVTTQDTNPSGLFFNPDGTKLYVSGTQTNRVFQYTLSIAYNISTAVYDNKSFDFSVNSGNIINLFIKPDGNKVYIVGKTNKEIYQYTLTVPWDISTAEYDSKSVDTSILMLAEPLGVFFEDNGLKMYFSGGSFVVQLNLSSAWDISTATDPSKFISTSATSSDVNSIFFSLNGTKLFFTGNSFNFAYSYTLSTAWDISTATYDNMSFDLNTQDSFPSGIFINPNGSKMYIVGTVTKTVYQYLLGNAVVCDNNTLEINDSTKSFCFFWKGDLASGDIGNFEVSDGIKVVNLPVNPLTKKSSAVSIRSLTNIANIKIKQTYYTTGASTFITTNGWGISKIN